jgi:hypothetical protein
MLNRKRKKRKKSRKEHVNRSLTPHLFCVGAFNTGSKRKQFCGVPAVGMLFLVARRKQKTRIQKRNLLEGGGKMN